MKKILTVLTVTMITASLTGCCCRRCCPWLDRGAYCGSPAPVFAPLAATAPAAAPVYQPYTYAAPMAATNPCCPAPAPAPTACCTSWDPCQGQVNYSYAPAAAPAACGPAPCAPMNFAPMSYAGDPGCGYIEPGCGQPYMGTMSYGPVLPGGCDTCTSVPYGGAIGIPTPDAVAPGPGDTN
jgi:hypothetical protein